MPVEPSRIAHFAWLNYSEDGHSHSLAPAEYWSIRTFAAHHPAWRIMVHSNCVLDGDAWCRLVCEAPNVEYTPASLFEIPEKLGRAHGVQKSDWLLASRLLEHGGAKLDMADSVTAKPFDSLLESTPLLQSCLDSRNRHFCTAVMLAREPGCEALAKALELFTGAAFNPARRACFEVAMQTLHRRQPELFAKRWPYTVAFPWFYDETAKLQKIDALPADCVHVHWWTSSDKQAGWTANKNAVAHCPVDGWQDAKGAYADCIRIAMRNAGAI